MIKTKTIVAWPKAGLSANHGIFGVTLNEKRDRIYISCLRTQGLLVIDGSTNRYEKIIPLDIGGHPGLSSVVYNPVTNRLYTTASNQNKLCIVDAEKEKLIRIMEMPDGPRGVTVDPKRGYIFVAHYGEGWFGGADTITVLDKNEKEIKKIKVKPRPWEMTVDPEGDRTYVSCKDVDLYKPGSLCVIDNESLEVVMNVRVGRRPRGVAVNHKAGKAYVACRYDSAVYVVDVNKGIVLKRIDVNCDPIGVVFNPHKNEIYVINRQGKMRLGQTFMGSPATLSIIDCLEDKVIKTIELSKTGHYAALNSLTQRLYVPCEDNNDVWIVDVEEKRPLTRIPLGRALDSPPSVNPENGYLYYTSHISDELTVIDGRKGVHVTSIPVGGWPWQAAVNPRTNRVYVDELDKGEVGVIDGFTNKVIARVNLGVDGHFAEGGTPNVGSPIVEYHRYVFSGIGVDSSRNRIYVTCPKEDSLIVIDGENNSILRKVYIGWQAHIAGSGRLDVLVNEKTNRIYLFNNILDLLLVLDGDTYEIIDRIDVPREKVGRGFHAITMVLDSRRDIIYVGPWIIDIKNNTLKGRIPENVGDQVIAINSGGTKIYVTRLSIIGSRRLASSLTIADADSYEPIETISFERPGNVLVDPSSERVYVSTVNTEIDVYEKPNP